MSSYAQVVIFDRLEREAEQIRALGREAGMPARDLEHARLQQMIRSGATRAMARLRFVGPEFASEVNE